MGMKGLDQKPTGSVTKIESQISDLMREVLQVGQIKVTKNFFEMGADSIHLTQVATRLHSQVGKQISIIEMFKYPSIRALSQYIAESEQDAERQLFRAVTD